MTIEKNQILSTKSKRKFPWLMTLALIALISTLAYLTKYNPFPTEFSSPNTRQSKLFRKPSLDSNNLPASAEISPADGKNPAQSDLRAHKGTIPIMAAPVRQEDVPVYLEGLGTVTSLRTVTIRSRVEGELINIAFNEGQRVKSGDFLAEIDPRSLRIQLQQAQGQLTRDSALLKNAQTDLERYKTLLAQDSIAVQQTVTQESLVNQYRGLVAIDTALVDNAKLQLSFTRITAPIEGRIGLRLIDEGNMVRTNDATGIAVITQMQPIAVIFTLPEDALPKVKQQLHTGNALKIEAFDRSGKEMLAQGHLLAVDNQIDLSTGTVKLKGQFNNTDEALFANQFVNVKMLVDTLHAALTIPSAALQNGVAGAFVYVVQDDQTVGVRPVKIGAVVAERSVVLEGLQVNDQVVVDGADKLREGQKIKIITPESPPADNLLKAPEVNQESKTPKSKHEITNKQLD